MLTANEGSIPACAGEPMSDYEHVAYGTVYPRVCGGTGPSANPTCNVPGLSPRVRGNRWQCDDQDRWLGSIPARAGEPNKSRTMPAAT